MMYKKIEINSETDLPKEDGWYFVAKKNTLKTAGLVPRIYTIISKKQWLQTIAYYLLPISEEDYLREELQKYDDWKVKTPIDISRLSNEKTREVYLEYLKTHKV